MISPTSAAHLPLPIVPLGPAGAGTGAAAAPLPTGEAAPARHDTVQISAEAQALLAAETGPEAT